MPSQQYEFDSSQNELIADLANKMRFVSYFLFAAAVLAAVIGFVALMGKESAGLASVVNAIFFGLSGYWTGNAASSFQRIVDTQGHDIENLMGSLGELRKFCSLQYWLLIFVLVCLAAAFLIGFLTIIVGPVR